MTNSAIEDAIRRTKAETFRSGDGAFFILFSKTMKKEAFDNISGILDRSVLLKDSQTTRAGLTTELTTDNSNVFLKRTNNKNFKFTCKYLFRPARVFRAMLGAEMLERLGIDTPKVLACGEKRSFLKLEWGAIATATQHGMAGVNEFVQKSENPEEFIKRMFAYAGATLSKMHSHDITHGDMKLCNFYFDPHENSFGIWDLDGIKRHFMPLPSFLIENELSHVCGSVPLLNGGKGFFSTEKLADLLLDSYTSASLHALKLNRERVIELANARRRRTFNVDKGK